MAKFFVQAITARCTVIGYGVYDSVGGMVSEHARYDVAPVGGPSGSYNYSEAQNAQVARTLAQDDCDHRNSGIAVEGADKPNHFKLNLAGRKAVKEARLNL